MIRQSTKKKKRRIHAYVSEKDYKKVKELATKTDYSLSKFIASEILDLTQELKKQRKLKSGNVITKQLNIVGERMEIHVYLPIEKYKEFKNESQRLGYSMSYLVNVIVKDLIEKEETEWEKPLLNV